MAVCDNESALGLTGEESECCVYNYEEEIVSGYLLDVNTTIGDGNTTIKCQFKPEKTKGKKDARPAVLIYSTDADQEGLECNTLAADLSTVVTGVWANVVSSAGISSLVCKYSPLAASTPTISMDDQTVNDNGGGLATDLPAPTVTNVEPGATYSIVTPVDGLTIDPNTGVMTYDYNIDANTDYSVTIEVLNNSDGSNDTTTFTLHVINNL